MALAAVEDMSATPIRRTLTATFLNEVANHPDVRPWLGDIDAGSGALDLTPVVESPENVCLVTSGGGFVTHQHEAGIFEVHSLFLPSCRGRLAFQAMVESCQFMFIETDCVELLTRVPANNRAAKGLARSAGFEERFTRPKSGHSPDGLVDVAFHGLTIERWMMRSDETLRAGGRFHDAIEHAKEEAGSALPVHADDPAHDHAAGTAALMVQAGQPIKAVETYNRWARFAGYLPITLLTVHPPAIDLGDAIVTCRHGEMEVLRCR